ncbi:hypothetical protein, partial [Pseudomonas aeruginosa]|uniref:hypothetical protein n=1 Tax=Pseudomonas aeruginosa TaxID=287 RepID=UPI002B40AEAB
INPATADFLEFEYKATGVPANAIFTVYSSGLGKDESAAVAKMSETSNYQKASVRLSHYWKWFCQGNIKALVLQTYPCKTVVMRNFRL